MVDTFRGKPYLFLEYIHGGDLSNWIGTPRLTKVLPQVLHFAIQFCDGMTHALAKGIKAHRDIKPQNCLVTVDGTLKVTDFGLAKIFIDVEPSSATEAVSLAENMSMALTHANMGMGTPHYMAPEQFDDARGVDVRADIYSFGVMFYQMVTGKLPFVGRGWLEFEQLHKRGRVPPLGQQPSELDRIVERCLAKEPASRYGDFGEVRNRLAELYEELAGEAAPQPVRGTELNAARWGNKGVSLNQLGRSEEALACHDRALELEPHDEMKWMNKGNSLYGLGRLEEALACYDRALEINPHDAGSLANKGVVLNALGRPEEALACYERAIEIEPHYAEAWYNKGSALGELGQQEEELACVDHALEIDPRYAEAW